MSIGDGWFRGWLGVVEGVVAGHGVQGQDAVVGQGGDGLVMAFCLGCVCAGSRPGRRGRSAVRRRRRGTWRAWASCCHGGKRARRGSMSRSGV